MSDTALNSRLKFDLADNNIRIIVNTLYNHILRDYVARANERDIIDALYKFYTESDIILISKQQLRVYQELEKHSLGLSELDLNSKPPLYACGCGELHPQGFMCLSADTETI